MSDIGSSVGHNDNSQNTLNQWTMELFKVHLQFSFLFIVKIIISLFVLVLDFDNSYLLIIL